MNRIEIYQKSVDVLLDSYNNSTLEHSNCTACACGNLVAAANNYKYVPKSHSWADLSIEWESKRIADWYGLIIEEEDNHVYNKEEGIRQINSTGYTIEEFIKIEEAFEKVDWRLGKKEKMFDGLKKVLNVLKEIHEVDIEKSEENQEKLEKIYKNKLELV